MASLTFDAALDAPDNDASHLQLQQLIAASDFEALTFFTAERYLHAFCNPELSYIRRRWLGLALAKMLCASREVVNHLKSLNQELPKLGSIILSNIEKEETKIVAGFVIRQALSQGIEYNSFWASEKVRNSAPGFPKNLNSRWMADFQDFLDSFHSLALTKSNNDTSIMYPISLIILGEFKWANFNEGIPVAIIQAGMLTVIMPDWTSRDIHFLAIPIEHIRSARCEQSTLHDSQARTTEHEPWDLALTLEAKPWSYCLDTTIRTGTEVVFVFEHSADAREWESCIKEHQHADKSMGPPPPKAHPRMSSSSPIKCGSKQQVKNNTIMQHNTAKSTGPFHANQPSLHSKTTKEKEPISPSDRDGTSLSQSIRASPNSGTRVSARIKGSSKTAVATKQPKKNSLKSQPLELKGIQNESQLMQAQNHSSTDELPSEGTTFAETGAVEPETKPTNSGKGKLPRVSQSAKDRAFRRLLEPLEDLDVVLEELKDVQTTQKQNEATSERAATKLEPLLKPSKPAVQEQLTSIKNPRSRAKRKVNDGDDDFIPEVTSPKKNAQANGASRSYPKNANKKQRKKAYPESPEVGSTTAAKRANTGDTGKMQQAPRKPIKMAGKAPKLQEIQPDTSGIELPPTKSARPSLIKTLVDTQKHRKASKSAFRKPLHPAQSVKQPSTPTRPRMRLAEPSIIIQTPVKARQHSFNQLLHAITSSSPPPHPLTHNSTEYSHRWTPGIGVSTEMLSSNSKPVPASPSADSTAISGHADRKDVNLEKERADVQTAKSNPFRKSRLNQKATSFLRRLTGEGTGSDTNSLRMEILDSELSEEQFMDLPAVRQSISQSTDNMPTPDQEPVLVSIPVTSPLQHNYQLNIEHSKISDRSNDAKQAEITRDLECSKQRRVHLAHDRDARLADRDFTRASGVKPVSNEMRFITGHNDKVSANTSNKYITASPRQAVKDTKIARQAFDEQDVDMDMDGEETLINHSLDDDFSPGPSASSIFFPSSPPLHGSLSRHSSTSAEIDQPLTDPLIPSSEAEEMEWEASLNPHQRALHDLLIRTSKRVLRHIVDNETAVTDIAEVFEMDGENVLQSLLQRHNSDYEHVFHDMDVKGKSLQNELRAVSKQLAKHRAHVRGMV